jgi:hypothetical protein
VELFVGAVVLFSLLWLLSPVLGATGREKYAKGLSAFQTIFALIGIALAVEWYLVEQPDAARLKFDQTLTAVPLPNHFAMVIIEINISNVGGHADEFRDLPYHIYVQQVAPVEGGVKQSLFDKDGKPLSQISDADNWILLSYKAGGKAVSAQLPKTDDGLSTIIAPNESENYYFRAAVPCVENLHVSVSSHFQKPQSGLDQLFNRKPVWWIKQSFLDLTDACKKGGKLK